VTYDAQESEKEAVLWVWKIDKNAWILLSLLLCFNA